MFVLLWPTLVFCFVCIVVVILSMFTNVIGTRTHYIVLWYVALSKTMTITTLLSLRNVVEYVFSYNVSTNCMTKEFKTGEYQIFTSVLRVDTYSSTTAPFLKYKDLTLQLINLPRCYTIYLVVSCIAVEHCYLKGKIWYNLANGFAKAIFYYRV